jgi:hypothetical protein
MIASIANNIVGYFSMRNDYAQGEGLQRAVSKVIDQNQLRQHQLQNTSVLYTAPLLPSSFMNRLNVPDINSLAATIKAIFCVCRD